MATTPKQANNNALPKGSADSYGKRKQKRGSKGSYLSKWLDKTLHHVQGATPSSDTDVLFHPTMNWPTNSSQFAPGYEQFRYNMYGCMAEPMSLPSLPSYYNTMMPPYPECRYVQNEHKSVQVQRPRLRRRVENKAEELSSAPSVSQTCPGQTHYLQPKTFSDSHDYTSLPPIVTSMDDTNSISDMHTADKDEGSNHRRFSDPCVRGLPDVAKPANGDVDSASESSSDLSGSQVGSRLLSYLLDQISSLKIANERLHKELQDTKSELESSRMHPYFPQGQPTFAGNGVIGGQYSPGFVTDLVREIRDGARLREEAMFARMRAMVHERNDSGLVSSETKMSEKALEEIKSSLRSSEADKRRMMDRIGKLEDELRVLRVTNGSEHHEKRMTNGSIEDADSERARLCKELADMRKGKQTAEEHAQKLERLVTQLRSKFNGLQVTNGPDSLPSDQEHEFTRIRRISNNSNSNSTSNLNNSASNSNNSATIFHNSTSNYNSTGNLATGMVFGPVTDL